MKGQKTGGRQKGTPNKITSEVREFVARLVSGNTEVITNDFLQLEPERRLNLLAKLLPYIVPKMQPGEITTEQENEYNGSEDTAQKNEAQPSMEVVNQSVEKTTTEEQPTVDATLSAELEPSITSHQEKGNDSQQVVSNGVFQRKDLPPKPIVHHKCQNVYKAQDQHIPFYKGVIQKRRKR